MTVSLQAAVSACLFVSLLVFAAILWLAALFAIPFTLAIPLGLIVAAVVGIVGISYFFSRQQRIIDCLTDGIRSFKDQDFSVQITHFESIEMSDLILEYNSLSTTLKKQRHATSQRELLLDTILQVSPVSILLLNQFDQVVYANDKAGKLLNNNKSLSGLVLHHAIANADPKLQTILLQKESGFVTFQANDEKQSYYFSRQSITLNHQPHVLLMCQNLSSEMSRQEVGLWKNAIRLISHELNNSLAPISSLTNSANTIVERSAKEQNHTLVQLLPDMLATINRRTENLSEFVAKYSEFARLPAPNISEQPLQPLLDTVNKLYDFTLLAPLPVERAFFDPIQVEQVMINLVKNAHESGSKIDEIGVKLLVDYQRLIVVVVDRGVGMEEEKLANAVLPFFSTKPSGTGIGLSICNEVAIAHGGQLKLFNREKGGLMVQFDLPLVAPKT
ncbi:ATP-binding protein [Pseudoalteromonas sp. JC3]|uniref:sensor histidine kinase n=1 Tax=Pseudoalteromonas sp. JC3 TaxID=2810196 RepID=UPI0019D01B15|nr:ATP-binding protein [Pseudoalteromonas sp. JC3]MBR8845104.1 histidine kinase [Pseudoalteromonas sp. JC3]WJE07238.1 ATP-binding protein [Pseudoalteromonas sp. JC3]